MTNVKLNSFRIQNFRSIKDTGWKTLASDNITVLIGQNESGKTTILEALQSFYSGEIIEDILRSDQSMPEVSCRFTIEKGGLILDFIDIKKIPETLKSEILNQNYFIITRKWKEDKSSIVSVVEDEIYEYYHNIDLEEQKNEELAIERIESILIDSQKYMQNYDLAEHEKNLAQKQLSEKRKLLKQSQKALKKAKKPDQKLIAEKELNLLEKDYNIQEKSYAQKSDQFNEIKAQKSGHSEKLTISKNCKILLEELSVLKKEFNLKQKEVIDNRHILEISTRFKDQKKNKNKLEASSKELNKLSIKLQNIKDEKKFQLLIADKILNESLSLKAASQLSRREIDDKNKFYTLSSIGEILFTRIPVFEFFEDFSGLLPNKIDLENILNEHENIEGYKAAMNFLRLAGLEASFYREKNHRILKQRIEALNSDVTINFQDYWSQQVGKNSKIKLHFELEHYDYTVPDKSGKPYIEFWIKDKQERLYPKQRSRGVRWFLSFYLELKATEALKTGNRVLLIDEPGISLHARAQEDVLKVFEDLKESMQIIYCTHSPHLVNTEKLYRVLAVQRANEEDDRSESLVFEANSLNKASADTLTPIYSLMGIRFGDQQFIRGEKNLILQDLITYYYLQHLSKLVPEASNINFIPSTNENTLPLLINILAGWQVNFGVLILGKERENLIKSLNQNSLLDDISKNQGKILHISELELIEDVFSTIDFKKYILLKREGITETNSDYITNNDLSRKILAINFVNNFNNNNITIDSFDDKTKSTIIKLFNELQKLFKT